MGGAGSPPQANGPGRDALSTATNGKGSTAGAVQRQPPARSQVPMPHPARPSPAAAYTATIRPLPLHHPSLRRVRLTARQVNALTGMPVPLIIDGTSKATPCTQGELAIQDAVTEALGDREVCAVLYRWSRGGELWVMCDGRFVQVANIELVPARAAVAA